MTNPFQAPSSHVEDQAIRPPANRSGLFLSLGLSVLTAAILSVVVPRFHALYASFGAELPWLTGMVLAGYWVTWLIPLCLLGIWFSARQPGKGRQFSVIAIGLVSILVVLPVCIYAMYAPLFALAAVR